MTREQWVASDRTSQPHRNDRPYWRCLNCGNVEDATILANRVEEQAASNSLAQTLWDRLFAPRHR